jgi:hypothetical protein
MAVQITCINKDGGNHENPYVAIRRLGWRNPTSGETGVSTREQMYQFVVDQRGQAYVESGDNRARLVGQISPRGTRYVKTEANSTERDNLLKLPECG